MAGLEKTKDLVLGADESAKVALHMTDVSKEPEVKAMVQSCVKNFGRIDCAMNNAGVAKGGSRTTETSLEIYDWMVSINEKGVSRAHAL